MGLVVVSLDAEMKVEVTKFTPMDLPGYNDASDVTPLRLVKFILTSPPEDLKQIMSPLPRLEDRKISGVLFDPQKNCYEECEWETETLLGHGGFGYVCALTVDAAKKDEEFPVVKATMLSNNYSKLKNEKDILDVLCDLKCDNFPECTDALFLSSSEDSICALKFSARGVCLPKYLRCVAQDSRKESFKEVVRVLGPAMVEALRVAHLCAVICHCDVRPPNMILVPPVAVMTDIAKLGGDILERQLIGQIDISTVRCILNDWGEAKVFKNQSSSKFENQKRQDLTQLVNALTNPAHLVRGSDISASSGSGSATPAQSATEKDALVLNATTVSRLQSLATALDYSTLKTELAEVTFE